MTTTDNTFCKQLRLTQLYNIPLTRYTPINPYLSGKYTKMQLDMRRKVEILKYSPNKVTGQTNNLTKNQKFAMLVKGRLPSPSQSVLKRGNINCDVDNIIPTPTSSCDVPRKVQYLYYDENVPLYNYSDYNTRVYPDYIPNKLSPWQFVVLSNIVGYTTQDATIYYLIINNVINQPLYTYNIVTPIGISIAGTNYDFSGNLSISVISATLSVYFNDSFVKNVKLLNLENYNMTVHFSDADSFSANQFVGVLNFNNIELYTSPTYVYTFVLNVTLDTSSRRDLFDYIGVISNISLDENKGCTVVDHTGTVNLGASITAN